MNAIETVEELEQLLSEPTEPVVETLRRLQGDILLLGAGGKIGPSLARMARRASDLAGVARRVIGVSRFSNAREEAKLQADGIVTMRCDLPRTERPRRASAAHTLTWKVRPSRSTGTAPAIPMGIR